jgi:DNA-binding protein HU-beta
VDLDALIAAGEAARVDLAWPDEGFGSYTESFEAEAAEMLPDVEVFAEEPATLRVEVDGALYRFDLAGCDGEESGDLDPAPVLAALGLSAVPAAALFPVAASRDEAGAWSLPPPGEAGGVAAALGDGPSLGSCVSEVRAQLRAGRKVMADGVGVLSVRTRSARRGVDPRTGRPVVIPAEHSVQFKLGKGLKDALSGAVPWAPGPAEDASEALLQAVARVLLDGEAAEVPGLGTWRATKKGERRGTNPATGEPLVIASRVSVQLRVEPGLVQALFG